MRKDARIWLQRCSAAALIALAAGQGAMDARGAAAAEIDKLTVLGDSYSALNRKAFPNWAEQLKADGTADTLAGFARSGATAATVGTNHFKKQYNAFVKTNPTFSADDLTVVYFGYNDINRFADLGKSKADYSLYVNNIVKKGVTRSGDRLFLVMPHDWGRNPAQNGDPGEVFRERTLEWNRHVASVANGRQNTVAVDLFSFFENVFENPSRFGLKNVTTPKPAKAGTTHLFEDSNHFGQRGQALIKQVFEEYLSRSANLVATLEAGGRTTARLAADLDESLTRNQALLTADERQAGLAAFAVGEAAALVGTGSDPDRADVAWAGFAQTHPADGNDGGIGLDYELDHGLRLGFVIGQYEEDVRSTRDLASAKGSVASDSVAIYAQQALGPLELGTRFIYSDETHRQRLYDELVDQGDRATFGGRTMELSQRAGLPIERESFTLTPWVQLTQRTQDTDSFTLESPYVSDTTYQAGRVSDTEAAVGLDAVSRPLALGETASLVLFGGLSYTHSLVRDDYEVAIREEAVDNFTQRESVERPELRTVGLNLGAQVQVGERLSLGAGLGLSHDPALGMEEAARVELSYRF